MGYLDRTTLTVDAILTKKGRELLARGQDFFKITQFALADDEIDYRLWNEAHPSGSSYYGYAIEQLPLVEPIPDETQVMRYKLVSLPKTTTRIPTISLGQSAVTLIAVGDSFIISPTTVYSATTGVNLNATLGYTAILHNSDVARLESVSGGGPVTTGGITEFTCPTFTMATPGAGIFLSDSELAKSVWVTGFQFRLTAKSITATTTTKVTIVGNESGGSTSLTLTVNATPSVSVGS